jgi:hypothetical protein
VTPSTPTPTARTTGTTGTTPAEAREAAGLTLEQAARLARPRERLTMYLYVLECQKLYKIGVAWSAEERAKTLQTGCPYPITLVHRSQTPGGQERERYWHREFGAKRVQGEWFKLNKTDLRRLLTGEKKELAHYRAGRKVVTQDELRQTHAHVGRMQAQRERKAARRRGQSVSRDEE